MAAAAPRAAAENLCDSSVANCRTQLLTLIQNEHVGIDVAFWFMQDARYSNEIIKRWQAGVPVRVLVDPRANPSYPGNADIIAQLQQAGIPLRKRTAGGILHWKMMLFAGQNTVEFGSANFSPAAFVPGTPYTNYVSETIFYEDDAAVVDSFKVKFDDSWTDTTNFANFANIDGPLQRTYPTFALDADMNWPPKQDYGARAVARYNAETQKIDVDMYRVTDQRHTNAIIAAFQRGVPVRYLGETLEYRNASRLWVAWNMDRMYVAGIPMRVRASQGENHAKIVLLYGQGMTIFGSSNWTSASATSQQEHNYFTTKSAIFQWFEDLFNRKWNNSAGHTETAAFVPLPPDKPVYQSPASDAVGVATSGVVLKW
ncbi:MAG: phospholipase D-like domain-containing protein, partial [Gemmatimonadaceae bacterium]